MISLLLGGLGGLGLPITARHADLAHPTAIALSALGIAVADEGEEEVSLFSLAFDFGIAVLPSDDGPVPTEQAGFLPLRESNLALVAVLMTDRLGGTDVDLRPHHLQRRGRGARRQRPPDQLPDRPGSDLRSERPPMRRRRVPSRRCSPPSIGRSTTCSPPSPARPAGRGTSLAGAVDDAVQAVASAVGSWFSPWQEFLRAILAEEAPATEATGLDGGHEAGGEDHPTPAEGSVRQRSPRVRPSEDGIGPDPMGLDTALTLVDVPASGDRREDRAPEGSSSGAGAIVDLSAGVFFAAVAYQACWSERRIRGRVPEAHQNRRVGER